MVDHISLMPAVLSLVYLEMAIVRFHCIHKSPGHPSRAFRLLTNCIFLSGICRQRYRMLIKQSLTTDNQIAILQQAPRIPLNCFTAGLFDLNSDFRGAGLPPFI
jgi:hypothetical protein